MERLFDYTKWHLGIYLSVGGGLVALLGSTDGQTFLSGIIHVPWLAGIALGTMVIAGISGGIVASASTRTRSFSDLWDRPVLVYGAVTFFGRTWAAVEHTAFWASLLSLAASVLLSR